MTFGFPFFLETNEVLRIRLGVVVRHVKNRIREAVDRRVVQDVLRGVAQVGGGRVLLPQAVLPDDDATGEDVLISLGIGRGVRVAAAVGGIAGEVHSLAVHGRILPAERSIESLLDDLLDGIRLHTRSMSQVW